jgi:hypothetical protein
MAEMKAALIKLNFILDVARKDIRFLCDLQNSPFKTLMESGIDLSPGELQGAIDIVTGTAHSQYASALTKSRVRWAGIVKECATEIEKYNNKTARLAQRKLEKKPSKPATSPK